MEKKLKRIETLKKELALLEEETKETEKRKFKVGDWVCFNDGEYPDYFSKEVGQITHFDYTYSGKGIARFKNDVGGGWGDKCLRFAHPEEIAYAKSGLPFIYNKKNEKYERVELFGSDFKIGNLIDTRKIVGMSGKELITFLMETDFLNDDSKKHLSVIFEKLRDEPEETVTYHRLNGNWVKSVDGSSYIVDALNVDYLIKNTIDGYFMKDNGEFIQTDCVRTWITDNKPL